MGRLKDKQMLAKILFTTPNNGNPLGVSVISEKRPLPARGNLDQKSTPKGLGLLGLEDHLKEFSFCLSSLGSPAVRRNRFLFCPSFPTAPVRNDLDIAVPLEHI